MVNEPNLVPSIFMTPSSASLKGRLGKVCARSLALGRGEAPPSDARSSTAGQGERGQGPGGGALSATRHPRHFREDTGRRRRRVDQGRGARSGARASWTPVSTIWTPMQSNRNAV